jgi:hypothetical protein
MARDLFKRFVSKTESSLPQRNLPSKALLELKNAPSYPSEEEFIIDSIGAVFIPLNAISLV